MNQRRACFHFGLTSLCFTEDERSIANKLDREAKVGVNGLQLKLLVLTLTPSRQRENESEPISKEARDSQADPTLPVCISQHFLSEALVLTTRVPRRGSTATSHQRARRSMQRFNRKKRKCSRRKASSRRRSCSDSMLSFRKSQTFGKVIGGHGLDGYAAGSVC